eukprot:359365-Chlamydomonas_euryale.AAC.6
MCADARVAHAVESAPAGSQWHGAGGAATLDSATQPRGFRRADAPARAAQNRPPLRKRGTRSRAAAAGAPLGGARIRCFSTGHMAERPPCLVPAPGRFARCCPPPMWLQRAQDSAAGALQPRTFAVNKGPGVPAADLLHGGHPRRVRRDDS